MKKCLSLFFFLSFFLLAYCPLSKAYTYDEFMQFVSDIKDANIGDTSFFTYFLSKDTATKQAFTNNNLNINDYNNWLLWWNSQYNWSLWFYNGTVPDYTVLNENLFSSITFSPSTSFKYCFSVYNNSYSYVNYSNYNKSGNTCLFLFDKNPVNDDFKGAVAQNYLNTVTLDFSPASSSTINVTANNVTEQFIKITGSRQSNYWRLGVLMDYFDYPNVQLNFGAFVTPETVDNIASLNVKRSTSQGNNLVGSYSPTEEYTDIYIKTSSVLYYQGYMLDIQYLDEGVWKDYDSFLFYFVPFGDTSSSGDLINPEFNSDIDLSVINAFNQIFSNDDLDYEIIDNNTSNFVFSGDINNFLSGDISGDFLGIPFIDHDNWGFGDLIKWIFNSLYNVLSNYDNVTLNFGFLGNISSSVFVINNTTVATTIGLICDMLFILLVVFFYWRFIRYITTLDLNHLLNYDVDNMFNFF